MERTKCSADVIKWACLLPSDPGAQVPSGFTPIPAPVDTAAGARRALSHRVPVSGGHFPWEKQRREVKPHSPQPAGEPAGAFLSSSITLCDPFVAF